MKWLVAFLACFGIAQAQIIQHQISDDSYTRIPLQFGFPYYGRIFTDSYMFSNGVIGFGSVNNHWCCTGYDLANARGYEFNFSIMPLQTDLINYGQGRFLTEGTPQFQRYVWENISEYGSPNNLNTFGVEIRPSGYIGIHYEKVNISSWRPVTIGMTGDTTVGEFTQHYHGSGFNEGAGRSYIYEPNPCLSNPLHNASCVGYQEAYLAQQCSISALYSSQCTGYAEAYALANIVSPVTYTPTIQVSTTGTVSFETPIIPDPVVNEVVTRQPTQSLTAQNSVSSTQQLQSNTSEKPKETAKKETKQEVKQDIKQEVKQSSKSASVMKIDVPNIVSPPLKVEQVNIVDLLSKRLVSPKVQTDERAFYLMVIGSQKLHEEMIEAQYGR